MSCEFVMTVWGIMKNAVHYIRVIENGFSTRLRVKPLLCTVGVVYTVVAAQWPGTHCQRTFEIRHCHHKLLESD